MATYNFAALTVLAILAASSVPGTEAGQLVQVCGNGKYPAGGTPENGDLLDGGSCESQGFSHNGNYIRADAAATEHQPTCFNASVVAVEQSDLTQSMYVRCYSPTGGPSGGYGRMAFCATMTFAVAEQYCADLVLDTLTDWRLPMNVNESATACGTGCGGDAPEFMFWVSYGTASPTTAAPTSTTASPTTASPTTISPTASPTTPSPTTTSPTT
eukprot:CAMPEP_0198228790 /NCGR_PEP_ID=MMETSP1445-20131203/113785_1 /TAXON_ID=36898 /ORGANISM="Pyramimonas sp., Strain CCMP2087" /LENGTH=213 /DNA_ID=CAMNT_0043909217 /DNA_START=707 /DNA_END=1344 /DNA_ORIENTATION=-